MCDNKITAPDPYKRRVLYKKHQGSSVQLEIMEMINVESILICGTRCVGKTDCSAFKMVEDDAIIRCQLMKEGTGVSMQDFFTLIY